MSHPIRRRSLLLATASTAASAALPARAQQQQPKRTLRVGHQKGWMSILKSRGTLEQKLAPLGARAAFERGAVDAWIIWDPFYAAAEQQLGARLLSDAAGVVNNRQYLFTSRDFATRNADALRIAIAAANAIEDWAAKNQPAAADELSRVLGLDRAITSRYLARAAYGTKPVTRDVLAEQQAIADTFHALKLIPKKLNLLHAAPVDLG